MPRPPSDVIDSWHFPKAGLNLSLGFSAQPNRPGPDGTYWRTTRDAQNVRTSEVNSGRDRGASRSGLIKWQPLQIAGEEWITQELTTLVGVGYTAPGGGDVQLTQSGRIVSVVAVSLGRVFSAVSGDVVWTEAQYATADDPPLNIAGLMYSAANLQKLWIVDGDNYVYFDPALNTVYPWTASAGELPVDDEGNYARLICTWRGRTVLAGLPKDPQDWFMSKVGDPTNFDYAPSSPSSTDAIAGQNAPQGFVGDVINCLIPYSDDTLIMGGDHSITVFRGDPLNGGNLDLVTNAVGMTWGMPYCMDPAGTVYFFSNRTGVFSYVPNPGEKPKRISQGIETLLQEIDTGSNNIRLLWDERMQGLHVFVTPLSAAEVTTNYFWEARTGAWWKDRYARPGFQPTCCTTLDGNLPNDRVTLVGCWDGFVRALDPTATKDDGRAIESYVLIGPILTKTLDDILLKSMQAVLATGSGDVTFQVFVGATAEEATSNAPVLSGTWRAGRNYASQIRRAGHAIYVKLSASSPWAMESIRAVFAPQGMVRQRGR